MDEDHSLFELDMDPVTSKEFLDLTRWQKMFAFIFLAIIGLLLVAFITAWDTTLAMLHEAITGEGGKAAMIVIIGIIAVITAVLGAMSWFLIRGAGRIRAALKINDQVLFNRGLSDLKTFFIIYGVIGVLELLTNIITLFS